MSIKKVNFLNCFHCKFVTHIDLSVAKVNTFHILYIERKVFKTFVNVKHAHGWFRLAFVCTAKNNLLNNKFL